MPIPSPMPAFYPASPWATFFFGLKLEEITDTLRSVPDTRFLVKGKC